MSGATTNIKQVIIASAQGGQSSVALNNKPLTVKFSDLGKFIEINLKKKTVNDDYPIVEISYSGKDAEAIGSSGSTPDQKFFKIMIPVSAILEKASSGEVHQINISFPEKTMTIPIKVDSSELPEGYKTATASANQFYQGVFTNMARTGNYQVSSLLMVMPRHSGKAKTDPEGDPYYRGGHGALTVLSKSGDWTKVSEEKPQRRPDSLYSINVFERKLDPNEFTGAMKEEFEKLPPDVQQNIREKGIVRLNVRYYTDTLKGFDALLQNMADGEFQIVQTLGHRVISFRDKVYKLGQKKALSEQPPIAYFGNHCNSRTSDNVPFSHVLNLFAPVGTNDSLFPGADLNLTFLNNMLNGNVDPGSLKRDLAATYKETVRPGSSQAGSSMLFKETPTSGYNPYLDLDGDHLPAYLDADPQNPNPYRVGYDAVVMTTANGLIKVPYSGIFPQSVTEHSLKRGELSRIGIAGGAQNNEENTPVKGGNSPPPGTTVNSTE